MVRSSLSFDHTDVTSDQRPLSVDDVTLLVRELACSSRSIDESYNSDFARLVAALRATSKRDLSSIYQNLNDKVVCRKQW